MDFFHWGAFALPEVWAIAYGAWLIFLVALIATFIPYALLLIIGTGAFASSVEVIFGVATLGQMLSVMVRLWAGINANRLAWKREVNYLTRTGRAGRPRKVIAQYLATQRIWSTIGMAVMLVIMGATIAMDYSVMREGDQTLAYGTLAFNLVWLFALFVSGWWMARKGSMYSDPLALFRYRELRPATKEEAGHPYLKATDTPAAPEHESPDIYTYPLVNGVMLPALGFNTHKIEPGEPTLAAVAKALDAGYRLFDTASIYDNEYSVGQAIAQAEIPRDELFLASKVWNDQQGYIKTIRAFEKTCANLGVDYLDLYLIHWPRATTLKSTWRALEHLYRSGKARAIGVCNFEEEHLNLLLESARIAPMVNQIEIHPRFTREKLILYCWNNGILVQSWMPTMGGEVASIPEVTKVARAHGRTEAQVALRWAIQHNIAVLAHGLSSEQITEHAQIFDFVLTSEEMAAIDEANRDGRVGPDPADYSW
ncbi:MAG: aldo/keto reductase [Coriobacteriia bacterium]|nr:aldo/keto reductase [Coriobacteriia bacterium]